MMYSDLNDDYIHSIEIVDSNVYVDYTIEARMLAEGYPLRARGRYRFVSQNIDSFRSKLEQCIENNDDVNFLLGRSIHGDKILVFADYEPSEV